MSINPLFRKRFYTLLGVIALIAGWALLFFFFSPQELVEQIGAENIYVIVFLIALLGGVFVFTSTSFYASIATFAAGGADVALLGLFGGIGLFLSDLVFYTLVFYGKKNVHGRWKERLDRWSERIKRVPSWIIYTGVFLYSGFTPFPNDILMAALAISGYRARKFWPYLLAGSISIVTWTAVLGARSVELF